MTYHAWNTESKETERDETEKLSTETEKRNQEGSWRLGKQAILESKGKCTGVLLQELDKVLDQWQWISQGSMSKPMTVSKDISTCFHLAMATWTLSALCREKALSELPNRSMVENGSSHSSTQCN